MQKGIGGPNITQPLRIKEISFSIKPINRLTPSVSSAFSDCHLRGVLLANKIEGFLLKSPKAYLGSIIHILLEESNKGIITNFDQFETRWDYLIKGVETHLSSSPLTRHLIPFNRTIPDLLQKKFKCWEIINIENHNHIPIETGQQTISSSTRCSHETELWVQTRDGLVGGYIDSLIHAPEGTILLEYKSGSIFSKDSNSDSRRIIRDDYLNQIILYAGLFYESFGSWPIETRIISIANGSTVIRVNPLNYQTLIDKLKKDIALTNCIIRRESNRQFLISHLASPSNDTCLYCNYRPICSSYWNDRSKFHESPWPRDVIGIVQNVVLLGNNTQLVTIIQTSPREEIVTIRGLAPSRYDLSGTVGKVLAFYNLNSDVGFTNYKQGLLTTIYLND